MFVGTSFDFCLKMSLFTLICPSPPQYSASPSLLPSLYGRLQRPASLRCWTCSDGILRSSSSSGSTACCLCPLCCLSEPPGPPWVCLQTAWPPSAPSAHHHPADVPGILRHGQSSFASLMVSASLFLFARCHIKQVDLLLCIVTFNAVICLSTTLIWMKHICQCHQDNYSYGRPAAVTTFDNKPFYQTSIASAQRTPTETYYQTGESFLNHFVIFFIPFWFIKNW